MSWLWRRGAGTPGRAIGRVRLVDNDVVPMAGHRRYADLLRPNSDDCPLLTPGQAARSLPPIERYRPHRADPGRAGR